MKEKEEMGTLRRRWKEWLWQIKFLWDCVGKNLLCFHGCHGNTVARVQQETWWWNGEAGWEVPAYLFEITVAAMGAVCSFTLTSVSKTWQRDFFQLNEALWILTDSVLMDARSLWLFLCVFWLWAPAGVVFLTLCWSAGVSPELDALLGF